MKIPIKKLKTGFEMPVFGLGTWQMGGRLERDFSNNDEADIAGIKDALKAGITHIDTAEYYADGYSEILVSKAIKDYDRSKIFLVSKVKGDNFKFDDVIAACQRSLERLGTTYLDLYLLHWYEENIPLKETIAALDKLVSDGLVKNIGVCNFNKEHLAEAQSYTKNKIVCDQVHYNLMFREPEATGLLEYCQKNDVFLMAWRPIGKGNLLEKVPVIIEEMCKKYNKTPAQLAINWLVTQPNVITLSKTSSSDHLKENLGALDWKMEGEDIEKLRNEYPNQKDVSDTMRLE